MKRRIEEVDPKCSMTEHPGGFCFVMGAKECLLVGDGRLLGDAESNLWDRYMRGEDTLSLSEFIISKLNAS